MALIGVYKFEEESFPSVILQRAEHSSVIKYLKLHPEPDCFAKIVRIYLVSVWYGTHYIAVAGPD